MSNKKQQIPTIRFNGFTDPWEQRKLKDVAPLQRGFDLPKSEISEGPYPVLFSNGIGGWHSEYKAKAPGVITGRSGSIGNVVFIEQNYWPHNTSLWVTNFFDNCPRYVYYLYHHVDLSKFGTGSGVPTLNRNDVHDYSVIIPKPEEQSRIATFFKKLDDTIALHQRQLDNYREWKKAMLQKMFPQDGEKIPEVRFEGFTGEWEERKVNDIFHEIFSGNRLPKTSLVEGDVPYIIAKVTNNGEYMKIDNNSLDYHGNKMKLFPSPSITFSIDNPEAIFVQKYPFFTSNIMRVLHNPSLSYNQNIFFYLWIKSLTTYFNWSIKFSGPVVMNSIIYIPINEKGDAINFDEIERVGGFFKQLDDNITLHQQKIDDYQQLKNTMLQQMFV